ncbi:hypothetical protein MD484_g3154, partial [Candolleomyces efflorescens]
MSSFNPQNPLALVQDSSRYPLHGHGLRYGLLESTLIKSYPWHTQTAQSGSLLSESILARHSFYDHWLANLRKLSMPQCGSLLKHVSNNQLFERDLSDIVRDEYDKNHYLFEPLLAVLSCLRLVDMIGATKLEPLSERLSPKKPLESLFDWAGMLAQVQVDVNSAVQQTELTVRNQEDLDAVIFQRLNSTSSGVKILINFHTAVVIIKGLVKGEWMREFDGVGALPDVPDDSQVLKAIGIDKTAPFVRTSFYWFCFVTVMTLFTPYTLTSNKGSRKKILGQTD